MSKRSNPSDKLFWLIEGYDSTKLVYEKVLSGGLSVNEMTSILQRLECKHLDEDEIVAGSLRRNYRGYTSHLEPLIDGRRGSRFNIMVGLNQYYIASIWRGDELDSRKGLK